MSTLPNEQQDGYSLIPTTPEGHTLTYEMWDTPFPLNPDAVIEKCREFGWTGAHVYTGPDGPIHDGDPAAEGNPINYHGWIDARQEAGIA